MAWKISSDQIDREMAIDAYQGALEIAREYRSTLEGNRQYHFVNSQIARLQNSGMEG